MAAAPAAEVPAAGAPAPGRAWRPAAIMLAVALASTLAGYAAGRTLRAPPAAAARATR